MSITIEIAGKSRHMNGWKPDHPDHRDKLMAIPTRPSALPTSRDNSSGCSPVEDQGDLGSCTANSTTSAMEFIALKDKKIFTELSRLFVYYYTRKIEGTPPTEDSGAYLRNVMKCLRYFGAAAETKWPYDISKFAIGPAYQAIRDAQNHRIVSYMRCPGLDAIRSAITLGYTAVGGFSIPESILGKKTSKDGIVSFPSSTDSILGGHAVHFVGYDDKKHLIKFQNSWGTKWGDKGYGYLPYRFVAEGLADDFWTIRSGT